MFKRFNRKDVSTSTQVKTSVQRALKSQLLEKHPNITEEQLDVLIPKKNPLVQYKLGSYTMIYCRRYEPNESNDPKSNSPTDQNDGQINNDDIATTPRDVPILYQDRDGPILPTLKLVHQYPTLHFSRVTVDKGAIPFLLGGANVMCPGLTNPGGEMPPDDDDKPGLKKGDGVVIFAEGKEYAIGVGIMTISSAEVRAKNKGVAIELLHYLGDGLYEIDEI